MADPLHPIASTPYTICPKRLLDRSRKVARSGISPINQKSSETVPYVETAKTSHTRGLRNCGQTPMVLGYGTSQYANHGRPRCRIGYNPAQATANNVIASAKRLIEVRHSCRSKSRIAEINVPAWPIPIHQTKLTIAKPQPIGIFTPQIPMPRTRSQVVAYNSSMTRANETPNPASQCSDHLRVSTIELILSVTVAYV